jgi:alkanesulfonate monooxygenase SsuD/methylene tetrahydromethanopterin reductase-like flavin-dependent oxidoreductase (luciferase family)
VTREVMEAEELGYDSIWIAEHHFSNSYGVLPDPFVYLGYLAARTSRIKLGSAVMVVPLHHPLRIVENAAFVDILSNGRFQLGLGSGYRPYEFEGLGVSFEDRRSIQQEAIKIIMDGFHKKRIVHEGKHFTVTVSGDHEIFPQGYQQPHPPLFLGAGTEGSIVQAARGGFGLMQSSLPSAAVLGQNIALYRKHMEEAPEPLNQNPAFGQVDVVRMVYVAPTDARARAESEVGITRHMMSFLGSGTGTYLGDVTEKKGADQFSYENLCDSTIIHGSPETVIKKIMQLKAVGCTSIMLHYPPYYGQEKITRMLRLFAKEVLPHIREDRAASIVPLTASR